MSGEHGTLVFLDEGTVVGGAYRVIGPLAGGSAGVSMLAEDERLGRRVVLKLLALRANVPIKVLLRSAKLLGRVTSDQVASVYDTGDFEGRPFVVMEHVEGQGLAGHFSGRRPTTEEALDVIDQLGRGLEAIHATGAVHGALCPENVVVGPAFRVTICDFGVAARDVDRAYVAPEALLSDAPLEGESGRRADVYSLAAIAYELLFGSLVAPTRSAEPSAASPFDGALVAALTPDPHLRTADVSTLRRGLSAIRAQATFEPVTADVLVVDDDPDFRALAELCLRTALPGAVVHAVSDGSAALACIESTKLGLALFDLEVPGVNGIELTAALRGTAENASTPVLVVTGRGTAADWQVLAALGADGFVVKPVDPSALVSAVRRVVERPSRTR